MSRLGRVFFPALLFVTAGLFAQETRDKTLLPFPLKIGGEIGAGLGVAGVVAVEVEAALAASGAVGDEVADAAGRGASGDGGKRPLPDFGVTGVEHLGHAGLGETIAKDGSGEADEVGAVDGGGDIGGVRGAGGGKLKLGVHGDVHLVFVGHVAGEEVVGERGLGHLGVGAAHAGRVQLLALVLAGNGERFHDENGVAGFFLFLKRVEDGDGHLLRGLGDSRVGAGGIGGGAGVIGVGHDHRCRADDAGAGKRERGGKREHRAHERRRREETAKATRESWQGTGNY